MNGLTADHLGAVAAVYVHTPFCSSVCPYCDFAVVAGADDMMDRYTDAVCTEIGRSDPWQPLGAVYFGGGTPSRLAAGSLGRILEALARAHGISPSAELSIEANPEDFTPALAASLRRLGFNRVSFGAQSFDPDVLSYLGRRHGPADIASAVEAARSAGFEGISVDLIFGSPAETASSWETTIESALGLGPGHISAYGLTVEGGTPLGRAVRAGAASPDPDDQADRYEMADLALLAAGMRRYEVSNWSLPGEECIYNMVVWAQGDYLAYGNGAHGYREGRRFRNVRRIDAYLAAIEEGRSPRSGIEVVSGWGAELDRIFVGLRRVVGVARGAGVDALVDSVEGRRLLDAGVIALDGDRLVVRKPLLTDMAQRVVLALPAPDGWAEAGSRDIVSIANA